MNSMRSIKKYAPFAGEKNTIQESGLEINQGSTIPYFSNIPEDALAGLMEMAKTLNYTKKMEFGFEHSKANSFFVVFFGNVTIISPSDGSHNSKAAMLQVQEPRLGIGKAMLITDEIGAYYEIGLEKVLYAFITKKEFFEWMATYPDVKFTLLGLFDET